MHHILCTETRSRPGRTPALVVETTHLLTPADLVDMFNPEEREALAQGTVIRRHRDGGSIRWVDLQAFYRSAGGGVTTAVDHRTEIEGQLSVAEDMGLTPAEARLLISAPCADHFDPTAPEAA